MSEELTVGKLKAMLFDVDDEVKVFIEYLDEHGVVVDHATISGTQGYIQEEDKFFMGL